MAMGSGPGDPSVVSVDCGLQLQWQFFEPGVSARDDGGSRDHLGRGHDNPGQRQRCTRVQAVDCHHWQVEKTTKSGDTVEYKAIKGTVAAEIEISSAGTGASVTMKVIP